MIFQLNDKIFQSGFMYSRKILLPAFGAVGIINLAGTNLSDLTAAISVAITVNKTPAKTETVPIVQLNGIGNGIGNL